MSPTYQQIYDTAHCHGRWDCVGMGSGRYLLTKIGYRNAESYAWSHWFIMDDHTYPNDYTRGYLLEIDGMSGSHVFYTKRMDGLCSGSKLTFTAYVANVTTGASYVQQRSSYTYPKLSFIITDPRNGSVLARHNTDTIGHDWRFYNTPGEWRNSAEWQLVGMNFTVPEGVEEAELRGDEFGEKKTVVRLHRFKKMRQLLEDTKLRDDSDGIYDAIKNYFEDDNYYNDNSKMDFRKEFRGEMKKIEQDIASINVNMTQVALLLRKGQYKTGIEKTLDIKKKIRNADNSFQTQVTDSVTFCVTNGKDKDNIDYFDMIVADAVYTVGEFSGKEKITISDIIRCMTGDPKTRYYRRKESGEMDLSVRVKKSVDKLNAAKITIMHKDLRGGKKVKFSGMALECGLSEVKYGDKKIKDKRNGVYTDVTMYNDVIIYKKSPLYEYAEYCNGEFMTIPHKMLNVMITKSDADGGEKLIKMPDSIVNIKIKFFLAYQTMLRKMSRTEGISLSYKNPELRLFGSDIESQKRKYLNDVFGNGKKEELFDKNGAENSKYRASVSETIDKVLSYYERYFITKNADGPLMVYIKVYRYRKSKKGAWKKYICRENEGRFKYSEIFFDEVIGGIEKTNEERRKQIKKTNKKNCFPIYEVCGSVENLAKYDPEFIGYLIIFH